MKKIIFISFLLSFACSSKDYVVAQEADKIFTIYLVRHSEKDYSSNNVSDLPLSKCGIKRSKNLSYILRDVNLNAIYSTNYTRTKNTALPTAEAKELNIKNYNANDLVGLSKLLISLKEDALVVGHSNTTGVLAGLLIDEELGAFDLDIYDRIYQVVVHKNKSRLQLLHSGFLCNE